MNQKTYPRNLPLCKYPKASDLQDHGLYELPKLVKSIDWEEIIEYRSREFRPVPAAQLSKPQLLSLARMVARSFVENEPMKRHLQPPQLMPAELPNKVHRDPFGIDNFGEWTSENNLVWVIRLLILTNPSDPPESIKINTDSVNVSVAILDDTDTVIGGAFNMTVNPEETPFRAGDPFLDAVMLADKPIFDLIFEQEHQAMEALKETYPNFRTALENYKVGSHFMVARSSALPKADAFELVAASAETLHNLGYQYMVVTASNQWTGAACEALHGTRVHFSPFRRLKKVPSREMAAPTEAYSSDGYISAKDSGAMFYLIKLN